MFYSQFILAKKGPLGTIWIAAHLERKLRKNQVADTDIGVSVDSILFPDVPIALRLSSHLLLGVVRIYSRKVNYLFDDCSEALLKVKQAFRSTAVDLPPEESTAPYHSITLPETFDLDDFELPDNEIFQGNYVDHHVSSREQITLQDSMDGVVYSTTQFGLDERFGDGDASGLDLDEELFLNNVTASGHAGVTLASDAEPHASILPITPFEQDKNREGINGESEMIVATDRLEEAGHTDVVEYAQAPCTPGLAEEPNFSKGQEASVCDDHMELGEEPNLSNHQEASPCDDLRESENQNMIKHASKENLSYITSNSDFHSGMGNAMSCSSPTDINAEPVLGAKEINQTNFQGSSPSLAPKSLLDEKAVSPASDFPDKDFTATGDANESENLHGGVICNNEPGTQSTDGAHIDSLKSQHETLASPRFSHEAFVSEDPSNNSCSGIENVPQKSSLSGTCQTVSECLLETNQALLRPEVFEDVENAEQVENLCPHTGSVASHIESLDGQNFEDPKTQACQDPNDSRNLNSIVYDKRVAADMHVLHPCNHLSQMSALDPGCDVSLSPHLPAGVAGPCSMDTSGSKEVPLAPGSSAEIQGEGCCTTDFAHPILEENHTTEPVSCEGNVEFRNLNDQMENAIPGDIRSENIDGSEKSEFPAPEKLRSVPEGLADLEDNFLLETTPDKEYSVIGNEDDAAINAVSGKKRSFTESNLTVQSLNSVESLVVKSKRTKESVPDDNDLLSSILVGRKSSVLKLKPTPPPPPEITSAKRPRSAPRTYTSKRKVLMDDSMVLHGDVIRQQLTSTEDIRRVRKKAPCTRPEIWMIQKEFLEDEIFSEPVFTGLSSGLTLLHGQMYDLSEIRISQNDAHNSSLEAAVDKNSVLQKADTDPLGALNAMDFIEELNVNKETGREEINESIVIRNDLEAEAPENEHNEDHVLQPKDCDTQLQMEDITNVPEPQSLPHEHSIMIAEIEIDNVAIGENSATGLGVESASMTSPVSGDRNDIVAASMVSSALLDKESCVDSSTQMEALGVSPDQKLDTRSADMETSEVYRSSGNEVDAVKIAEEKDYCGAEGGAVLRERDEFFLEETEVGAAVEIGVGMQAGCVAFTNGGNPSLEISFEAGRSADQFLGEYKKNEELIINDDEFIASELNYNGNNTTFYGSGEEPKEAFGELSEDVKYASLSAGEYPDSHEADLQCTIDAEITADDHTATKDLRDFDYTIDGHDTGFLNADDDDVAEDDEYGMPGPEQSSFLENSGWSSRTRAVAKYLQVLFVKEVEHGRKALPMDNLLVGKTRKEASRMFFETLVLKTKDYIHVEQVTPFENINLKPRGKLMKSEF